MLKRNKPSEEEDRVFKFFFPNVTTLSNGVIKIEVILENI